MCEVVRQQARKKREFPLRLHLSVVWSLNAFLSHSRVRVWKLVKCAIRQTIWNEKYFTQFPFWFVMILALFLAILVVCCVYYLPIVKISKVFLFSSCFYCKQPIHMHAETSRGNIEYRTDKERVFSSSSFFLPTIVKK